MNWLHKRIQGLATWPVVALLLSGCLLCNAGFIERQKYFQHEVLDVRGWYTPGEAAQLFEDLGSRKRDLYAVTQLTLDLVFPVFYGLLLAVLLVRLYSPGRAKLFQLLPLASGLADILENSVIAYLVWTFDGPTPLTWVAAVLTFSKFSVLLLAILFVVAGGFAGLRQAEKPGF